MPITSPGRYHTIRKSFRSETALPRSRIHVSIPRARSLARRLAETLEPRRAGTDHGPAPSAAMAAARRIDLADRWRRMQEDEDADDGGESSAAKHRRLIRAKEEW